MSEYHFRKLTTFLKKLDRAHIHYTLASDREDAIMVRPRCRVNDGRSNFWVMGLSRSSAFSAMERSVAKRSYTSC